MIVRKYLTQILSVFVISSCSVNNDSANRQFEEKFAKEVAKINAEREKMQGQPQAAQQTSTPKNKGGDFDNPANLLGVSSPGNKSAAFDTNKLHLKQPQNYTPDAQVLSEGLKNFAPTQIPPNIFELRYSTRPHPPFAMTGVEFDVIEIPNQDAYGIKSNLDDKQYLLAGNDSLQRSIDSTQKTRSAQDVEFSKILISEQKKLKKKQRIDKLFSKDEISHKEEVAQKEEEWLTERKAKNQDPIRKIIGAQIVSQNLSKNRPVDPNQVKK